MSASPGPPPGFRGSWHTGTESAFRASLVSGPFATTPHAYAIPANAEDVSLLVEFSRAEGIPLVPRGAGTGMPGGNLGRGIVFSMLEGFGTIHSLDAERRRIHVGAGTVAKTVEVEAETGGLTLPCLPSSSRWCTVGGMIANNAAGARSFGHGAISRWLEEVEGIDADGNPFVVGGDHPQPPSFDVLDDRLALSERTLPPWPAVRKNSSGYAIDRYSSTKDPAQLMAGSEGTLGIITAATLRLVPTPAARGVYLIAVHGPEEASALAVRAGATEAVACEFLGRRLLEMAGLTRDPHLGPMISDSYALFLLEFEGTPAEVEEGLRQARALAAEFGRGVESGFGTSDPAKATGLWAIRHRASPLIAREAERGRLSTQFIEDSVVPPNCLGSYLVGLDEVLARSGFDAAIFGHAGDGNVHVNPLVDVESRDWRERVRIVLDETAALVASLGGTLTGEHGDGRVRAPYLKTIWGPEWYGVFREIKDHFDPFGCLNPGVILPLPDQDPLDSMAPRARSWPG
jgi:FAD/FMN-containing dehydrogenase